MKKYILNVKKIIYNLSIFLILFYNFCIWGQSQNRMWEDHFYKLHEYLIITIDNIFRLSSYVIMFIFSLFLIKKSNKKVLILLLLSFILGLSFLITNRKIFITEIIIIFILQGIVDRADLFNKKLFKNISYLFFIGVLLQLYFFTAFNRRVMSIIDPNITAYKIFLLFVIFDKLELKYSKYIVFLTGLQTLSRNYILGVFFYFLMKINVIKRFGKYILKKIFMNSEILLSIFIFINTMLVAFLFLKMVDVKVNYDNNIDRIVNFADNSNKIRFEGYFIYFKNLFYSSELRNFGLEKIDFMKLPEILHSPHNVILYITSIFGVYIGLILYMFINRVLFGKSISEYIDFVLPWMIYISFFLGDYVGMPILLVGVIIAILRNENDVKGVENDT